MSSGTLPSAPAAQGSSFPHPTTRLQPPRSPPHPPVAARSPPDDSSGVDSMHRQRARTHRRCRCRRRCRRRRCRRRCHCRCHASRRPRVRLVSKGTCSRRVLEHTPGKSLCCCRCRRAVAELSSGCPQAVRGLNSGSPQAVLGLPSGGPLANFALSSSCRQAAVDVITRMSLRCCRDAIELPSSVHCSAGVVLLLLLMMMMMTTRTVMYSTIEKYFFAPGSRRHMKQRRKVSGAELCTVGGCRRASVRSHSSLTTGRYHEGTDGNLQCFFVLGWWPHAARRRLCALLCAIVHKKWHASC